MAATGIIEYLPVRDTELPIHQPPGTALDADAGRALKDKAGQEDADKEQIEPGTARGALPAFNVIRGYSYLAKHKGTGAWEKAKRGAG